MRYRAGWGDGVAGRVGGVGWLAGWGGWPGEVAGRVGAGCGRLGGVGWRAEWGWAGWGAGGQDEGGGYIRSYSQKGCLYGGVKNALRNQVG